MGSKVKKGLSHSCWRDRRIREWNRVVGGVCGGIAEQMGIDTTIVRLVIGAMVLCTGFGIGFYVLAWIVMPEE